MPPRRVSEKERIRLALEQMEQERIQAEMDVQQREEEERRRIQEEMRQGKEKDKRELSEQQLRVEQLATSAALIKNMLEYNSAISIQEKIDYEVSAIYFQIEPIKGLKSLSTRMSLYT